MKDFNHYLNTSGEIGFVDQMMHSLVYASGLPQVSPQELVVFENNDIGQVFSLNPEQAEILVLTGGDIKVGDKVTRTSESLQVPVGSGLLGRVVDSLGRPLDSKKALTNVKFMPLDVMPPKLTQRKTVEKPFETGVTMVDLVVPLGKGQRELVIGDRKTGKTEFLLQAIRTQAKLGSICIYAVIGQKQLDIKKLSEYFQSEGIAGQTVVVASSSASPSGIIYLTPYSAMTMAEGFLQQGLEVLLILDDMTTHARVYREISLLARRFPGRSSYPGDIFYIHAKLIERAGNFKKGSITALPVAESILGDLSGYVQTNLMAMTDGHIFFDIDLYNQGKRPAVNPFLSVTRVGHQTQTPLQRDVSRELSSFLVTYERMKQFLHFGAEIGGAAKNILKLGSYVDLFFSQGVEKIIPINVNLAILAGLWAGLWNETKFENMRLELEKVVLTYATNGDYQKKIDEYISRALTFSDLVNVFRRNPEIIQEVIK